MISLDYLRSKFTNPLVLIRFKQDCDIGMAFCADTKTDKLTGISLYYIRKTKDSVERTNPDLVSKVFKPSLKKGSKPDTFLMNIQPLSDPITIIQRPTKFICQFPFKDQKKRGKLTHIDVDADRVNKSMSFIVNASYRSSKTSPEETLTKKISANSTFISELTSILKQ